MKKTRNTLLIAVAYLIAFVVTLIAAGFAVNGGRMSGNLKTSQATMPVLYVRAGGRMINEMHAYTDEIDAGYFRDTLTPVGESRTINLCLTENDYSIESASYALYDEKYETLIESGDCSEIEKIDAVKQMNIMLRETLESNHEYCLRITLTDTSGQPLYYYTHIRYGSDLKIAEKLEFVLDFNEATFDPSNADRLENYLETKSSSSSSNYADVTIYSSSDMVTWGSLEPYRTGELAIKLKEINTETAAFTLSYSIESSAGDMTTYYTVTEYYRIRWTSDRVYLLYFERTMDEQPVVQSVASSEGQVRLGTANMEDEDFGVYGSDDHQYAYSIVGGHLWLYDCDSRTMTEVYAMSDSGHGCAQDPEADIRVLAGNDETGDLYFVVYGYMHQGDYEGSEGALFYHYSEADVRLEEILFIPYTKGFYELASGLDRLAYMNPQGEIYFMMGDNIYCYNTVTGAFEAEWTDLSDSLYAVSDQGMLAIAEGGNDYAGERIRVINLSSDIEENIDGNGSYLIPLGFDGANLVCGYVDPDRIEAGLSGVIETPMDKVVILDRSLKEVKNYENHGYYVMSVAFSGNNIVLDLATALQQEGYTEYESAGEDYIIRNQEADDAAVSLTTSRDSIRGTQYMMDLDTGESFGLITQTARYLESGYETLEDGVSVEDPPFAYYVYTRGRLEASFDTAAEAIAYSNEHDTYGGSVFTSHKQLLWQRAGAANLWDLDIDSVTAAEDGVSAAQIILDTICDYEGWEHVTVTDKSLSLYEQMQQLPCNVIDLTDVDLSDVVHFIYRDRVVAARTGEDDYCMIVGYDASYIQVAYPESGTVSWITWSAARTMFSEAGNVFISYAE